MLRARTPRYAVQIAYTVWTPDVVSILISQPVAASPFSASSVVLFCSSGTERSSRAPLSVLVPPPPRAREAPGQSTPIVSLAAGPVAVRTMATAAPAAPLGPVAPVAPVVPAPVTP